MKIIQLTAENVKRLRAVQIRPDGALVVIGGRNAQGKSSVLDAIMYALAGKGAVPAEPIRRGEEKAEIEVQLDDLVVRRTITPKGSYLVVENRDGARYPSPQAILDRLTGSLAFDPLEFTRLAPRAQVEQLRELVGLDFKPLDDARAARFEERTAANRRLRELEGALARRPAYDDAPDVEVSVRELAEQLDAAREHNEGHRTLERIRDEIIDLEERLGELKRWEAALLEAGFEKPLDEAGIRAQLATAEETNWRVRENAERRQLEGDVATARERVEQLGLRIDAIDNEKRCLLAEASFPVDGLAFDDDQVLYNGIPFAQASQAEQLRVSVAVGLALNPELKVLLVRDGSLLDEDNLAMIAELAAAADAQVWLERVGAGEGVSVIIEDGEVAFPMPAGQDA